MRQRGGFTLIELLIVIAMISIFSASLIAVMIAPAEEQKLADAEGELQRGFSVFHSRFVEDAHNARSWAFQERAGVLLFSNLPHVGEGIVYFVDEAGRMRRAVETLKTGESMLAGGVPADRQRDGAPLLEGVEKFAISPTDIKGRWSMKLEQHLSVPHRDQIMDRQIVFQVGRPWLEGSK